MSQHTETLSNYISIIEKEYHFMYSETMVSIILATPITVTLLRLDTFKEQTVCIQ